jgi:signal transduction histidine kinase/ligand-binding sensor domain-containing protein
VKIFRFIGLKFSLLFLAGISISVVTNTQEKRLHFSHLTTENGLSQNTIHGIIQDKYGFMWFGTWAGICKYDGYKFTIYRSDPDKENTIINNRIHYIYRDTDDNIWLTSFDSLYYCRYNYETDDFTRILRKDVPSYLKDSLNRRLNISRSNRRYKNIFWHVDQTSNLLYETDLSTQKSTPYYSDYFNKWAINDQYVTDLYIDKDEMLWIGTFSGGVNKASLTAEPFIYYHHSPSTENSLVGNNIRGLAEDNDGNLWIGTRSDGISILNRKLNIYKSIKHNDLSNNTIISNQIRKIFCDSYGQVWIGTKNGLDRYDPKDGKFHHYLMWVGEKRIPHEWVYSIMEDHNKNLWIGTWNGIAKYDRQLDYFDPYKPDSMLLYPYVRVMIEDRMTKDIWVATEGGGLTLLKKQKTDSFREKFIAKHYINEPSNQNSLINDRIYSMAEDGEGHLWIGTGGGLCHFDPIKGQFVRFTSKNGLPDEMIMGILIDNSGNIWVSHKKGITRINPLNYEMQNYSFEDGLQGNEFNEDAYFKADDGELFFGGLNGLNSFYPERINRNPYPPEVVFTNLYLFNKPVKVNQEINGRIVLKKSIFLTKELDILNSDKSFSIEFAGLHYVNPNGNQYKYMLEGFDNDWIYTTADKRIATYSNLKAKKYVFKVLASNSDGIWSENPKTLTINVLPPWWGTWWFRLLIIVIAVMIIYSIYYIRITIYRNKEKDLSILVEQRTAELKETNKLLMERQKHIENQASMLKAQTENLKETNDLLMDKQKFIQQQSKMLEETNQKLSVLNATKDKFFSIIAHDLRNPFHTVMGFSELLIMSYDKMPQDKIKKYIQLIHTSSTSGNNLLENLLQWSRSQTGKISFEPKALDLYMLVTETLSFLEVSILRKGLQVIREFEPNVFVFADSNMLQTIVRNLLNNAIKFSREHDKIIIEVHQNDFEVEISIADNGVGIPYDKQHLIFNINSPYTTLGTKSESGTGLGLVLCKEFVEKHNGRIWFESEPDKGSKFIFTLRQNHL